MDVNPLCIDAGFGDSAGTGVEHATSDAHQILVWQIYSSKK